MSDDKISLGGLDKAEVLAALFNGARAQGKSFLQHEPTPMTAEDARGLLQSGTHFGYIQGRVLKVNLANDTLDPWGYDRDNGEGAAARVIKALEDTGDVNPELAEKQHLEGTRNSAMFAREHLHDEPGFREDGGYEMTLADEAERLAPILDEILDDEDSE